MNSNNPISSTSNDNSSKATIPDGAPSVKSHKGYWILLVLVLGILAIVLIASNQTENHITENGNQYNKIVSISGNSAKRSNEFEVSSDTIMITYRCSGGVDVCTARLRQVGGEFSAEIFRGTGSSGDIAGEKVFKAGPGKFYVTVDTGNRDYRIEIYQGGDVTNEDITEAETQLFATEKFRNLSGYEFIDEIVSDQRYTYYYATINNKFSVQFFITPKSEGSEFDPDYTFEESKLTVDDVLIRYAYEEKYEGVQFIFEDKEKHYSGFISNKTKNTKEELYRTMEEFITSVRDVLVSD